MTIVLGIKIHWVNQLGACYIQWLRIIQMSQIRSSRRTWKDFSTFCHDFIPVSFVRRIFEASKLFCTVQWSQIDTSFLSDFRRCQFKLKTNRNLLNGSAEFIIKLTWSLENQNLTALKSMNGGGMAGLTGHVTRTRYFRQFFLESPAMSPQKKTVKSKTYFEQ